MKHYLHGYVCMVEIPRREEFYWGWVPCVMTGRRKTVQGITMCEIKRNFGNFKGGTSWENSNCLVHLVRDMPIFVHHR